MHMLVSCFYTHKKLEHYSVLLESNFLLNIIQVTNCTQHIHIIVNNMYVDVTMCLFVCFQKCYLEKVTTDTLELRINAGCRSSIVSKIVLINLQNK